MKAQLTSENRNDVCDLRPYDGPITDKEEEAIGSIGIGEAGEPGREVAGI